MFYGISGNPGAGKTLNAISFCVTEPLFANRPMYYHRIPLFMLDIDVVSSFSGWFYGDYFFNNKSNSALLRSLQKIHLEGRFAELDDFPYLELQYQQSNPVKTFMFWARRLYSSERLSSLDQMLQISSRADDDLTFDDIRSLHLNFTHINNPADWVSLPKRSVFLADEIHHYWPVRTRDKLPAELEAISTHRHDGKDLVFITQHFANTDVFIRRLMNEHYHYSEVGSDRIACYHRKEYIDIDNPFDKKSCDKSIIKKNKHIYGAYFSTDLATNNNRISKNVKRSMFLLVFALLLIVFAVIFGIYSYNNILNSDTPTPVETPVINQNASSPPIPNLSKQVISTIPDNKLMPWTAPIYHDSLSVVSYPDLMCFVSGSSCSCLTQQNTSYQLDFESCKQIAFGGVFNPFDKKLSKSQKSSFFN
ncbi:TPA: zonular occludens toxin domain-containing protein [Photobacterium damselae]